MAENGRFFPPAEARNTPIGGANYALHVDALLVARYLRGYAEARGLERIEGKVTRVMQRDDGFIRSVTLADGREIQGDFFIDCTGFKGLLIGQALGVGSVDWSNYLPCDRAIVTKTAGQKPLLPFTRATAQPAGWSWQIPLQHRMGQGYVYSSGFCSDAAAKSTLMRSLGGGCPRGSARHSVCHRAPPRVVETQLPFDRPCLRLCRAVGGDIHPHDCPWDGFFPALLSGLRLRLRR